MPNNLVITGTTEDTDQIQISQGVINSFNNAVNYRKQLTNTSDNSADDWNNLTTAQRTTLLQNCAILAMRHIIYTGKIDFGLTED